MQPTLIHAPWLEFPHVRKVLELFRSRNAPVFFAGGAVRDTIARRKFRDIDMYTSLPVPEVRELLLSSGAKILQEGEDLVLGEVDKLLFDVKWSKLAHALTIDDMRAIKNGSDFTIDTLVLSPAGELYDFFNGMRDLREGRITFVVRPAEGVARNPLGIVRFFRMFALYGKGTPDPEALKACGQSAHLLKGLQMGSIGRQMWGVMDAPDPYPLFSIMYELGILGYVFGFGIRNYGKILVAEAAEKERLHDTISKFDLRLASFVLAGDLPPSEATECLAVGWEMVPGAVQNLTNAVNLLLEKAS